jgi:hypothetical protein
MDEHWLRICNKRHDCIPQQQPHQTAKTPPEEEDTRKFIAL